MEQFRFRELQITKRVLQGELETYEDARDPDDDFDANEELLGLSLKVLIQYISDLVRDAEPTDAINSSEPQTDLIVRKTKLKDVWDDFDNKQHADFLYFIDIEDLDCSLETIQNSIAVMVLRENYSIEDIVLVQKLIKLLDKYSFTTTKEDK